METFEQFVADQKQTATEIETIERNYKKDPASRKDHAYYEERLRRLDVAWLKFKETDNKIRGLAEISVNHTYFTETFLYVSNLNNRLKSTFEEEMGKVPATYKPPVHPRQIQDNTNEDERGEHRSNTVQQEQSDDFAKVLRNQRALIRALKRNFDAIKAEADQNHPESYYIAKSAFIDKYMNDFVINNDKLWQSTEGDIMEGYSWDLFYEIEAEATDILSEMQQRIRKSDAQQNIIKNEAANIQLPKIQIPKFNGNYLQWVAFKDLYEQLVHNTTLSAVQKMLYLSTHLGDEPKNLIKHLPISTTNYATAWKILTNRYDNKRLIVTTLLNNLLSQQKLKNESAQALKNLHDLTIECVHGLQVQGIPVQQWDVIMVHMLVRKLDPITQTAFEQSLDDNKRLISLDELLTFLEHRFQSLETHTKGFESAGGKEKAKATSTAASTSNTCKVCGVAGHPIFYCEQFLKMSPAERLQWTQKKGLCVNCFKPDHRAKECTSRSCTKCKAKHNTLLHLEDVKRNQNSSAKASSEGNKHAPNTGSSPNNNTTSSNAPVVAAASKQQHNDNYVLLATARVKIIGNNGRMGEFRALLDSGSQVNLVTERVITKLSLESSDSSICIEGIGRRTRNVTQRINFELCALSGNYSTRCEAFILPNIVSPQPTQSLDTSTWSLPQNIKLADPRFNQTDKIDILIGAEFYHQLMRPNQIRINDRLPILQNTVLGWVVSGRVQERSHNTAVCAVFSPEDETTNAIIERFWKLDDPIDTDRKMSATEQRCETHFIQNVRRDDVGIFTVRLPFAESPTVLGNSQHMAFNRFLSLERRLKHNPELRKDYNKFMSEYETLGHMEEIHKDDVPENCYFMPHHCVLKPESTTTKLRVVFDASAKTSSGSSLNDILHSGPTVQSDLFSILLRFRSHRYVFTADIEKMYRQIRVHETDQLFQLIMWRYSENEDIRYYRLKTVTYGTTSAPYLATKCLQHLATQSITKYSLGASILRDDFYVDDCLSGANSISIAKESQQQLQTLLKEAGFKLRKWCSNSPQLLNGISPEDKEIDLNLDESSSRSIKTLGVVWLPKTDKLCCRAQASQPSTQITKRIVSSELARIFDPLGIFGPVVVKAKIFLQQLWELPAAWDEELPTNLQQEWNEFRAKIAELKNISVDRCVFKQQNPATTQIHTFADASERAYGAAIYIRTTYADKTVATRLICSKSRVAPIKKQTLPRLELCAAVLGVELTHKVKREMRLNEIENYFWTDSQIVLAWINSSNTSFHTFVANRIAKIHLLSTPTQWRHVPSKENPADAISRGLTPEGLRKHQMWFYGPLFLSGNVNAWPKLPTKDNAESCVLEQKATKQILLLSATQQSLEDTIFNINHRNSFKFLQHTIGYMLRFIENTKINRQLRHTHKALSTHEMEEACNIIIKVIQAREFASELEKLSSALPVNKSSCLASLNPFLDDHNILRVGGRLENSSLTFQAKHPAILPHTHHLVKLLLQMLHEDNRHCGPQALLAISRSQFWVTNGKTISRSIVHKCVRCTRAKPMLFKQLMGNLPSARVTPSRPFITSGVDYFGPVWIHYKIRGKKPTKAYVAVFCCFSTKAIHMEVVSDLSTDAFLGALRRFIARRGHCKTLYSDNATNFVGTRNKLTELKEAIYSQSAQEKILRTCSDNSIEFKFIPPRAPHFGGLWEAAVKSAKHLLVRSVSAASLTYEELETVITEIEAILNSRPLVPLSSDGDDIQALTPGHFLVGEPLTAPVAAESEARQLSLGTRWKITSELRHKFWKEWTQKYLHELQERGKWKTPSPNLTEGMLVIMKQDNTPVLQWPLGRVTKIYKGDDGLVRVVDVKTSNGILKRPIHKLAPLLNDVNTERPISETANHTKQPQKRSSKPCVESTPSKRKLVSYSAKGIFTTIVISLLLLPLVIASPIQITKFEDKPGIYFENIGIARLASAHWTFMVYYDLSPMWSDIKILDAGINTLTDMCTKPSREDYCAPIIHHFEHTFKTLLQEEFLLSNGRPKRAALDIVGNIAHSLFGVLDSEYAEDMSKTIENVKINENHIMKLLRNQTSVIDSTLNIIKTNAIETEGQFKKLRKAIYDDMHLIEGEATRLQQSQQLTSLITQLLMITTTVQQTQSELLHAVTQSHNGNISPLILTPRQLREELLLVKANLPSTRALPADTENLLDFYKLMKIRSAVNKKHVIFLLELPLVDQQSYTMFNLIAIPTPLSEGMITIIPKASFLAVNNHRDQYALLLQNVFDDCITLKNNIHVCQGQQARFSMEYPEFACEIQLFNNKTAINCDMKKTHNNITFISLHHPNSWIFATTSALELSAVCDNDILRVNLDGSGILNIDAKCVLKNHIVTLHGHEENSNKKLLSYASYGHIANVQNENEQTIRREHIKDFKFQLEQLNQLQQELKISDLPAQVLASTKHNYTVSYSTLTIVALFIILCISWKLISSYKRRAFNIREIPQPLPRQQISTI